MDLLVKGLQMVNDFEQSRPNQVWQSSFLVCWSREIFEEPSRSPNYIACEDAIASKAISSNQPKFPSGQTLPLAPPLVQGRLAEDCGSISAGSGNLGKL